MTVILFAVAVVINAAAKSESHVELLSQFPVNPPAHPKLMLIALMLNV